MRVYVDGCFDLAHFGHASALCRAHTLGTSLTVGVVADENVRLYKAPAILTLAERCELVAAMRGVDAVIPGVSHIIDEEFALSLKHDHGVDLIVHGDDDTTMPDGSDAYGAAKELGMFWVQPRTPGVSTTRIVHALLDGCSLPPTPYSAHIPEWEPRLDTIFVDGAFDVLHNGHVAFLREAKKHARYLVVGVHDEESIVKRRGRPPVLNLVDRARALVACKYVDGVILGTPTKITHHFLDAIQATRVARGAVHETTIPDRDRYKDVHDRLVYILSPSDMTLDTIRRRVLENRDAYVHKCASSNDLPELTQV